MAQPMETVLRFPERWFNSIRLPISLPAIVLVLALSIVPPLHAAEESPRVQVGEKIHLFYEGSYELPEKNGIPTPTPLTSGKITRLHGKRKRAYKTDTDNRNNFEQPVTIVSEKKSPPTTPDGECLRVCANTTDIVQRYDPQTSKVIIFTRHDLQNMMEHNLRCVEKCRVPR
jgi:hypothetical protein